MTGIAIEIAGRETGAGSETEIGTAEGEGETGTAAAVVEEETGMV